MLPLFDMMMQAQNGNAIDVMAKQFGLAQEQMAKATAALLPAFSTALKRNTANPYDFGAFITAMSSGNHVKYFEDMTKAFTPQGMADGNGVLGQLFGSKEMSRAIAAQAEQMTGIGQEIYKQMLPVIASALMGGLFKQASGQLGDQNPFTNTPMATMTRQWLEASGLSKKPEPAPSTFENPFLQGMQAFFNAGKPAEKVPPQPADLFAANPFLKAFQDMMSTGAPAPAPQPAEQPSSSDNPMKPFADMLGKMFDSGLEAQKEYQKSIDGLFETYRSKPQ